MTVGELKKLLEGVDDDTPVFLPYDMSGFTGAWISPCESESGISVLNGGEDPDEDYDIEAFVLAPHNFFEEPEFEPQLN